MESSDSAADLSHLPPTRATGHRGRALPAQMTSLIGREREVEALQALLSRPDVRLLTLTGAAGAGKTRLALALVERTAQFFEDGPVFVPLASIRDPALVCSAIVQALDLAEVPGRPLVGQVMDYLRDREMLLLLDNFEHVGSATPLVAELLAACRRLKVLVTSRAVLHLSGEHDFLVPALGLANFSPGTDAVLAAGESEAVELFVSRARAARHDFELSAENAQSVIQICERLDGLPLAIELAAARLRLLPPAAVLERLDRRLDLLGGGPHDLPARQQTLRGAIGWSYELLDATGRRLFRRLAVFAGGCTLAAFQTVCIDDDESIDALEGATALVDQSLMYQDEDTPDQPRLRMLETVREYGLEQLLASGEMARIKRRHAEFYRQLAEEMDEHWRGPDLRILFEQLERERDNLRAALTWGISEGGDEELGLRLGGGLWRFWEIRGHLSEGREWLTRLLALPEGSKYPAARAKALNAAGYLATIQGEVSQAYPLLEASLILERELGDAGLAVSLNSLGFAALSEGEYDRAARFLEEGLARGRETSDDTACYVALFNLARVAQGMGDYDRAVALHEESLALKRKQGDSWSIALSLSNLGHLAQMRGQPSRATTLFYESLALRRGLGDRAGIILALIGLAGVAATLGEAERAAWLLERPKGSGPQSVSTCRRRTFSKPTESWRRYTLYWVIPCLPASGPRAGPRRSTRPSRSR